MNSSPRRSTRKGNVWAPTADPTKIGHGAVVIAAITSCTNTSNPSVMVAAGLVAKKAVEKGLNVKPYVKTSLAPGSRVVTEYLKEARLDRTAGQAGLQRGRLWLHHLHRQQRSAAGEVAKAVTGSDLVAAAVISGNRNFEGRVHPLVKANYLASPAAGGGLCPGRHGGYRPDPTNRSARARTAAGLSQGYLADRRRKSADGGRSQAWPREHVHGKVCQTCSKAPTCGRRSRSAEGDLFQWDENPPISIIRPSSRSLTLDVPHIANIREARVLACWAIRSPPIISPRPATLPPTARPASTCRSAAYSRGTFNSYGARRGNDLVMARGTFANIRLKNLLVAPKEGDWTKLPASWRGDDASSTQP